MLLEPVIILYLAVPLGGDSCHDKQATVFFSIA
jgi:hypothetical protein